MHTLLHPKLKNCRRLFLRNYEVPVKIGVHDFEKNAAQRLLINVDLYIPLALSTPVNDQLAEVVDYSFIRDTCLKERQRGISIFRKHYVMTSPKCCWPTLMYRLSAFPRKNPMFMKTATALALRFSVFGMKTDSITDYGNPQAVFQTGFENQQTGKTSLPSGRQGDWRLQYDRRRGQSHGMPVGRQGQFCHA